MTRSVGRIFWSVIALVVAAVGLAVFVRKGSSELPVYVLGAERMLEGSEVYRTSDLKPFTYPPFFALPFFGLVDLSVTVQRVVWYCVTVLAMVFTWRTLVRLFEPDFPAASRARGVFFVLLAVVGGRHLLAIFENQSHDMLVLACTVAASVAWAQGQNGRAGGWAGLGAACKATPALFAVPFVLQRSGRALLGAALVGAVATFLPDVVTPRADGQLWVSAWVETMLAGVRPGAVADLSGTWSAGSILNQSLSGTLHRLTTEISAPSSVWEVNAAIVALAPAGRRGVLLAAQLLLIAGVAWLCRPAVVRAVPAGNGRYARLAQAAAVACGMVLLSPMSSKSHFGVLLLPIALAAFLVCRGCRDRALIAGFALIFVIGTLTTKGVVGSNVGNVLLAYGSMTWTAVLAMWLTARVQTLLRRAP